MILRKQDKKEKPGFNVQNAAFFKWERPEVLCFRHPSPLSGMGRKISYKLACEKEKMEVAQEIDICK